MNKEEIEAFGREAAKSIKTEADLNEFGRMLTKVTVEAALNAELDHHLGYLKHEKACLSDGRNGSTSKSLRTEDGQLLFDTQQWTPNPIYIGRNF
jgi:putative transposase